MKTYVLTVSRYFPATHKRKGESTYFVEQILSGKKKYTIRANYDLWKKRFDEIQEGKAVLSVRYWTGKPYRSQQQEILNLDRLSGIGVQKLEFLHDGDGVYSLRWFNIPRTSFSVMSVLAQNDGLSPEDFKIWFRSYDLSKPMAIIHFTSFRY